MLYPAGRIIYLSAMSNDEILILACLDDIRIEIDGIRAEQAAMRLTLDAIERIVARMVTRYPPPVMR